MSAVRRFGVHYCANSGHEVVRRWSDHVIFPDYCPVHGHLRYFTSRACYDVGTGGRKSLNPKGAKQAGILFGEWCLTKSRHPLVVVEGPLDCIALNGMAVALLGKFLPADKAERLAAVGRPVVMCLDTEGTSTDTMKAVTKLESLGCTVSISSTEAEDPAKSLEYGNTYDQVYAEILDRAESVTIGSKMRTLFGKKSRG